MPTAAQQTVKTYFGKKQVSVTKQEGTLKKSYEVTFADGDKIEFDSKGTWKEIKCRKLSIPAVFVPKAIGDYVKQHYPKSRIREIDKKKNYTEIKLSNGLDLKFNNKYELIHIER
ncbi:MAG: PepSY-like domain-containing protein [Prevotella sp.]|nr:PepSY-like domain-containing protein [Prevotella sp.]